MPRITILMGSPNEGGNTDTLCRSFTTGAKGAGAEVTQINLAGKKLLPCTDCKGCFTAKKCVLDDDMKEIHERLSQTDVLVLATPLHFFSYSSQLKILTDRLRKPTLKSYPIVASALLAVAANPSDDVFNIIVDTFSRVTEYNGWTNIGCVKVPGVHAAGDIEGNRQLDMASSLGRMSAAI